MLDQVKRQGKKRFCSCEYLRPILTSTICFIFFQSFNRNKYLYRCCTIVLWGNVELQNQLHSWQIVITAQESEHQETASSRLWEPGVCCAPDQKKKEINPPNKKKKNSHNQRTRTDSHQHVWDFRVLRRCQIGDWDKKDQCLVTMVTWADRKEIWD